MLSKSEKILMGLKSKQSPFANWQPRNSSQRDKETAKNDKSALGSDALN